MRSPVLAVEVVIWIPFIFAYSFYTYSCIDMAYVTTVQLVDNWNLDNTPIQYLTKTIKIEYVMSAI